jgi:hypothetical protein
MGRGAAGWPRAADGGPADGALAADLWALDDEFRAEGLKVVGERGFCLPAESPEMGEDVGVGQEAHEPIAGEVLVPDKGGEIPVQRQEPAEQSRVGTHDDQ